MRDERPRSSRLAATLIALGLSLAAGGIAFNLWMLRVQELPPAGTGRISADDAPRMLDMMSSYLIAAFVLVISFVVGSFVMVRAGRFFLDRGPNLPRTEYVDAWGRYRISEAEIDAATGGSQVAGPNDDTDDDDLLPDDRPDRPRDDD
jgi:hypothetical protein